MQRLKAAWALIKSDACRYGINRGGANSIKRFNSKKFLSCLSILV